MRALSMILGLALLALLPWPAAAQAPAPTTSIKIMLPPGPVSIALGAQHTLPLKITFVAANLVCAQDALVTLPITVAAFPSPLANVTARPSIMEAKFTIPAGAYQDASAAANGPFNKSIDATLTITVGNDAPRNHEHAFQVTATYAGGTPAGCQSSAALPQATGMAKHQLVTGGSNGDSGDMSGMAGMAGMSGMNPAEHAQMTSPPPAAPSSSSGAAPKKTPAAPVAIALGLIAVAALARSRRS